MISDKTNNIVATVTGLSSSPIDIAYDSGKNVLFVSEANCDVDVISDKSNSIVTTKPTKGASTIIVYDVAKRNVPPF